MYLPHRIPWASISEVDEICGWVYGDASSPDTRTLAIERASCLFISATFFLTESQLSAWKAITALPHALEATLSLLSAVSLDEKREMAILDQQAVHGGPSNVSNTFNSIALSLRQNYATAIVRLVNGLVDPMQNGLYARSIATIAVQIGLPQWLVELRHAATHEDLPSLELLRSGAQEVCPSNFMYLKFILKLPQSFSWLLHNYFIPMTTSSYNGQDLHIPEIRLPPISPILKRYKAVMKLATRDASLIPQYREELSHLRRSIERWIGDAQIAFSSSIVGKWDADQAEDADEERERWALERLCSALTERDGIVPTSVKSVKSQAQFFFTKANILEQEATLLKGEVISRSASGSY
jgi:ribosomal biogenesis protein LAS1